MRYSFFVLLFLNCIGYCYIHPEPGQYAINAEFLYLKPSFEDPYYAESSSSGNPFFGEFEAATLDFSPAFCIEGAYGFCNGENDARLRLTHLSTSNSGTVDAVYYFEFILIPPLLSSSSFDLEFDYFSAEALFGQLITERFPFFLNLQAGLNWVYMKKGLGLFYVNRVGDTELHQLDDQFWAIGPEIAIDASYVIWGRQDPYCPDEFSFQLYLSTSLLVGTEVADFRGTNSLGLNSYFENERIWRVIPSELCQAGFCYNTFFNRCSLSFELGYQFVNYHNALSLIRNGLTNVSFIEYTNVGMHGPYASVGIHF